MVIPGGAYIGGQEEGTPLVVCRAPYLDGVYPGKLVKGNCNISHDSREIYLHDFDVLVGQGGRWGPPEPGLRDAFIAGYEHGGPLYLCQALYRGGLHPGKVYRDACDISYAGREIPVRRFNVFYVGGATVATYGGAPYPATVIYRYENNTTDNHYYPPRPYPIYDQAAADRAARQRRIDAQQRAGDESNRQMQRDAKEREQDAQQRADYERNQRMQRDLRDRDQDEQQRAAYERNQRAQQEAEASRARAEGEAEENRQALKAQAQAEEEARRAEEIKRGEAEENRMAAEASANAEAEEDARKQAEIKQGEEEENRMAADAAKAPETPTPPNSDASSFDDIG